MPSAVFNQVQIVPWRTAQRSVPATLCWVFDWMFDNFGIELMKSSISVDQCPLAVRFLEPLIDANIR